MIASRCLKDSFTELCLGIRIFKALHGCCFSHMKNLDLIRSGVPLGDTGRFRLLEVSYESADQQSIAKVLRVAASCKQCGAHVQARESAGLTSILGGAILTCSACGNRQAISQGIFEAFPGSDCVGRG